MEFAVKRSIATVALMGVVIGVGVVGCKKNTPPPAPQAREEIQPVTPPPYIPPAQAAPVVVTPVEPAPVVAPEPPPPAPRAQPAPRSAPAPAVASSAPRPGATYTVQRGDTLSQIAVRAYGRGNTNQNVAAIKRANNLKSDTIRVGQKLKIPARTSGNKD